jgi:general secretion pathway protein H
MGCVPVSAARRSAGFTLLELMVVLVLIGIIFSFAVLSLGGDDYAELMEQETHRMMTLLGLASDEAVLRGDELAVLFTEDGYSFLILDDEQQWRLTSDDDLLKSYVLPEGVDLRLEVEGEPPILTAADVDLEALVEDGLDEEEELQPQVFILSSGESGEMTPFTVTFMSRQSRIRYHLTASLLGTLSWELEETL